MYSAKLLTHLIGAVIGAVLSTASFAVAQQRPASGPTAEQVYKNIKVLNGTPAADLNQAMHLIKADIGLDCEDCHELRDRAADTLKRKAVARDMWRMMIDLNKNMFKGEQLVTCYTCHRGVPHPANVPVLPIVEREQPEKLVLPSVDQILGNYIEALGGEQALRRVASRVVTGTQFIPSGPGGTVPTPAVVEKYTKAPNLSVNVYRTPTYTTSDGFDGTTAWAQNAQGAVQDAIPADQGRARRNADFYEPLNFKAGYAQMTVDGAERVNGRDAYVVVGYLQNGLLPEQFLFDTQTGLLLRRSGAVATQAGNSPFEITYEDYRDTGSGVKFPYLIRMNPASPRLEMTTSTAIYVTKVQDNVPIDDAKFTKPAPRPAATPR